MVFKNTLRALQVSCQKVGIEKVGIFFFSKKLEIKQFLLIYSVWMKSRLNYHQIPNLNLKVSFGCLLDLYQITKRI